MFVLDSIIHVILLYIKVIMILNIDAYTGCNSPCSQTQPTTIEGSWNK